MDGAGVEAPHEKPRSRASRSRVRAADDITWLPALGPLQAFGQRFSIVTDDAALRDYLETCYGSLLDSRTDAVEVVPYYVAAPLTSMQGFVRRGDELIGTGFRPSQVLGLLVWAVNRQVIERAPHKVVLHAAAADDSGRAVVLPAPMESGKTTLVAGLLQRGLGYLTDEAVGVADDLSVEGYAKPLSIDSGSQRVLADLEPKVPRSVRADYLRFQWQVPPAQVSHVIDRSIPRLLVFPSYDPAGSNQLDAVDPGDVLRSLVTCTFAPEDTNLSREQVVLLARMAERLPGYRLTVSDLDAACAEIISALNRAP